MKSKVKRKKKGDENNNASKWTWCIYMKTQFSEMCIMIIIIFLVI